MSSLVKQIKVQDDTYDKLTSLGSKKETYDQIIKKCIQAYEKFVIKKQGREI